MDVLRVPVPGGLFPGHQAGASLKHVSGVQQATERLGLFPGHQAGASLKRHALGGILLQRLLFPGHQAGASLKRDGQAGRPLR